MEAAYLFYDRDGLSFVRRTEEGLQCVQCAFVLVGASACPVLCADVVTDASWLDQQFLCREVLAGLFYCRLSSLGGCLRLPAVVTEH